MPTIVYHLSRKDVNAAAQPGARRNAGIIYFFLWRPFLKDPKDDMVLELAVEAQCEYIVTFNQKDFVGSDQFGIAVVTPQEFLRKTGVIS